MKTPGTTIALAALLATGCRGSRASVSKGSAEFESKPAEQISALGFAARQQDKAANARLAAASAPVTPAPTPGTRAASPLKLIFSATLQVEVPDFRAAVDEAGRTAVALGGYVSDRQSNEDEAGHERGQITLRIPSERFDGAVGALRKLGRVKSEGVATQDVTKAYADLETRLAVKRETATRLREILRGQTGKVHEVLEVEREIARVVEDIEQAEGERRYFDHQVSLSTITLSLYEPAALVTPGALDPVLAALRQSLRTIAESFGSLIELGAALLPWLVALYAAFRLALWRLRGKA
jgi:hypothetical protein